MSTLHYVFDPLCGWCYGAAPLISAARGVAGLDIALHAGGMMAGPNRQPVTPQLRDYVMRHDRRIAQLTGQPFGEAYFEGLLRDTTAVMDSAPPCTAILAAEALAGRGLDMLHRVQHAHYVEGRRIADAGVLAELARELGLHPAAFEAIHARLEGAATERHFVESRNWLARNGGDGFPTIVLEQADGALDRLDIGDWLSCPAEWADYLRQRISGQADSVQSRSDSVCSAGRCDI
ncbi:MAG TPA: DsbA family protein [Burkholderiaceae bacterium]